MDPTLTGLTAFMLALGGAFLGIAMGKYLPKHHTDADTKDVIKVSVAVVATLAALVAGLLISAAKNSFDTKDTELRRVSARIIQLDRTLAEYGEETKAARTLLRGMVEQALAAIWEDGRGRIDPDAINRGEGMAPMRQLLLRLTPTNEAKTWLRYSALQITSDIDDLRLQALEHKDGSVRWPFVAVLIFWFAIIFFSFGLFAPRNGTVYVILTASALSVSAALYLIVQMDRPYSGLIQISKEPLELVLTKIGR